MEKTKYTVVADEIDINDDHDGTKVCMPARYSMAILSCFGFVSMYGYKMNMTVALITMVNHTAIQPNRSNLVGDHSKLICEYKDISNSSVSAIKSVADGPFVWDEATQGLILSAYYWGFLVTQIIGGRIAERYSAKWLLIGGIIVNTIACLLTPVAAPIHYHFVVALRVLQGFGGGVCFPSGQVLIARWAPPSERNILASISYSGVVLGFIIFMGVSGVLTNYMSWSTMLYVEGGVPLIWCLVAGILLHDSPEKQKLCITRKERDHIVRSLEEVTSRSPTQKLPVPWSQIVRSRPFLAICVSHFCSIFAWNVLSTTILSFLVHVLRYQTSQSTVILVVANSCKWLFSLGIGKILAIIQTRGIITMTTSRKIAMIIASGIPACCMIGLAYVGCDRTVGTAILSLAIVCEGALFSGFHVNHVDIAPNFAGTLMGITASGASIAGFIVPLLVGGMTQGNQTLEAWRKIFLVTGGVYTVDVLSFVIFASAEVQPWNDVTKHNVKRKDHPCAEEREVSLK